MEPTAFQDSLFSSGAFQSRVGKNKRNCEKNMRVRVYRNLNKTDFFSILAMEGPDKGKVVGYAKSIRLCDCEFKVSEKGRQRVLLSQQRNVHAFCEGIIIDASLVQQSTPDAAIAVTYNPYRSERLFRCDTLESVDINHANVMLQAGVVFVNDTELRHYQRVA